VQETSESRQVHSKVKQEKVWESCSIQKYERRSISNEENEEINGKVNKIKEGT
jgi:hypothetical protein